MQCQKITQPLLIDKFPNKTVTSCTHWYVELESQAHFCYWCSHTQAQQCCMCIVSFNMVHLFLRPLARPLLSPLSIWQVWQQAALGQSRQPPPQLCKIHVTAGKWFLGLWRRKGPFPFAAARAYRSRFCGSHQSAAASALVECAWAYLSLIHTLCSSSKIYRYLWMAQVVGSMLS